METIETTITPIIDNIDDQEVMIISERVIPKTTSNSSQQIIDTKKSNMFQTDRTYVQILNEMFPNQTSYVEEGCSGPQHKPLFRIGVHVRGLTFHGMSRTKQKARHEAAKAAINYFRTGQQPHHSPYAVRHYNRYDNYHRYQPYYRLNPYDNYDYNRWGPTPTRLHTFDYNRYEPYFSSNYDFNYNEFKESQTHSQNNYLKVDPNSDPIRVSHHLYDRQRPTLLYDYQRDAINLGPNLEKTSVGHNCSPISSGSKTNRNDFTADEYNNDAFVEFNQRIDNKEEDFDTECNEQSIKTPNKQRIILRVMSETPVNQNPVSLIHELQPNAKWVCTELNTKKHSTTFEMRLLLPLADQCFTGIAKTKKLAKVEAASKALFQLYNITLNSQNSDNPDLYKPQSTVQVAQEPLVLKQDTANRIGAALIAKCTDIYDQLNDLKKWTVLSGIVLTDETNVDFIDVICLTTGTKCVKGDSLSMNGYALNDCHAEVLSRRAFIHYIYRQIERLIDNNFEDKSEFIVERRSDGFGFRIKTNIRLNLFISTAPCGDSRVFSPKEEESDAHPNRQTRGLLRAKIEGGEGTIPVKRDSIQTWDGILQGHQRLQFMSCSDKIALWNVVGIQGALLSHLIEPIYLSSVVLASLFNYEHLVRALHGRLNLNFDSNSLKGMPQQFVLNKCKVAKCQLKDDITRQLTKAPNYALNWIKGDQNPEVVSTESGRIHTENTISRLAKRSLFGRFCALLGRNSPVLATCSLGQNIPLIYRDGKTSSLDYQRAKTQCMQTFQEQNLGNWIQVPSEIDLFRL